MNLKGFFSKGNERKKINMLEIFLKEKEECKGPFYHITGNIKDYEKEEKEGPSYHISGMIDDPVLIKIDDYYKVADKLSIKNAKKHEKDLLKLPFLGISLIIVFFFYFELEIHFMILFCVLVLIILDIIHRRAKKSIHHRKYVEYRVLAETLRIQFYLSISIAKKEVLEILPWFTKKGIPWIEDILKSLPLKDVKETQSIMHIWILDQKAYHEEALVKAEAKKKKERKIKKIALYITILAYLGGLLFETVMWLCPPDLSHIGQLAFESISPLYSPSILNLIESTFKVIIYALPINVDGYFIEFLKMSLNENSVHTAIKVIFTEHTIRLIIRMIIGLMSVSILFIENYYGKMSLTEKINDHKRMILLYHKVFDEIRKNGEDEETIIQLAREYLNENSSWYAYQSKNKPELVL